MRCTRVDRCDGMLLVWRRMMVKVSRGDSGSGDDVETT